MQITARSSFRSQCYVADLQFVSWSSRTCRRGLSLWCHKVTFPQRNMFLWHAKKYRSYISRTFTTTFTSRCFPFMISIVCFGVLVCTAEDYESECSAMTCSNNTSLEFCFNHSFGLSMNSCTGSDSPKFQTIHTFRSLYSTTAMGDQWFYFCPALYLCGKDFMSSSVRKDLINRLLILLRGSYLSKIRET